jgi:hypothetical protein
MAEESGSNVDPGDKPPAKSWGQRVKSLWSRAVAPPTDADWQKSDARLERAEEKHRAVPRSEILNPDDPIIQKAERTDEAWDKLI